MLGNDALGGLQSINDKSHSFNNESQSVDDESQSITEHKSTFINLPDEIKATQMCDQDEILINSEINESHSQVSQPLEPEIIITDYSNKNDIHSSINSEINESHSQISHPLDQSVIIDDSSNNGLDQEEILKKINDKAVYANMGARPKKYKNTTPTKSIKKSGKLCKQLETERMISDHSNKSDIYAKHHESLNTYSIKSLNPSMEYQKIEDSGYVDFGVTEIDLSKGFVSDKPSSSEEVEYSKLDPAQPFKEQHIDSQANQANTAELVVNSALLLGNKLPTCDIVKLPSLLLDKNDNSSKNFQRFAITKALNHDNPDYILHQDYDGHVINHNNSYFSYCDLMIECNVFKPYLAHPNNQPIALIRQSFPSKRIMEYLLFDCKDKVGSTLTIKKNVFYSKLINVINSKLLEYNTFINAIEDTKCRNYFLLQSHLCILQMFQVEFGKSSFVANYSDSEEKSISFLLNELFMHIAKIIFECQGLLPNDVIIPIIDGLFKELLEYKKSDFEDAVLEMQNDFFKSIYELPETEKDKKISSKEYRVKNVMKYFRLGDSLCDSKRDNASYHLPVIMDVVSTLNLDLYKFRNVHHFHAKEKSCDELDLRRYVDKCLFMYHMASLYNEVYFPEEETQRFPYQRPLMTKKSAEFRDNECINEQQSGGECIDIHKHKKERLQIIVSTVLSRIMYFGMKSVEKHYTVGDIIKYIALGKGKIAESQKIVSQLKKSGLRAPANHDEMEILSIVCGSIVAIVEYAYLLQSISEEDTELYAKSDCVITAFSRSMNLIFQCIHNNEIYSIGEDAFKEIKVPSCVHHSILLLGFFDKDFVSCAENLLKVMHCDDEHKMRPLVDTISAYFGIFNDMYKIFHTLIEFSNIGEHVNKVDTGLNEEGKISFFERDNELKLHILEHVKSFDDSVVAEYLYSEKIHTRNEIDKLKFYFFFNDAVSCVSESFINTYQSLGRGFIASIPTKKDIEPPEELKEAFRKKIKIKKLNKDAPIFNFDISMNLGINKKLASVANIITNSRAKHIASSMVGNVGQLKLQKINQNINELIVDIASLMSFLPIFNYSLHNSKNTRYESITEISIKEAKQKKGFMHLNLKKKELSKTFMEKLKDYGILRSPVCTLEEIRELGKKHVKSPLPNDQGQVKDNAGVDVDLKLPESLPEGTEKENRESLLVRGGRSGGYGAFPLEEDYTVKRRNLLKNKDVVVTMDSKESMFKRGLKSVANIFKKSVLSTDVDNYEGTTEETTLYSRHKHSHREQMRSTSLPKNASPSHDVQACACAKEEYDDRDVNPFFITDTKDKSCNNVKCKAGGGGKGLWGKICDYAKNTKHTNEGDVQQSVITPETENYSKQLSSKAKSLVKSTIHKVIGNDTPTVVPLNCSKCEKINLDTYTDDKNHYSTKKVSSHVVDYHNDDISENSDSQNVSTRSRVTQNVSNISTELGVMFAYARLGKSDKESIFSAVKSLSCDEKQKVNTQEYRSADKKQLVATQEYRANEKKKLITTEEYKSTDKKQLIDIDNDSCYSYESKFNITTAKTLVPLMQATTSTHLIQPKSPIYREESIYSKPGTSMTEMLALKPLIMIDGKSCNVQNKMRDQVLF